MERNLFQEEPFDLVIMGGGITGLAIYREAARRGMRVCLLEKADFGGATSAATSKLIHGGLRYLENYEFDLVRESLRERRLLAGSAPRLVKPLPIMLPVYNYTRPGRLILRLGLWIYDLLSFDRNRNTPVRNRMPMTGLISRKSMIQNGFCLKQENLKGGFVFYDYQSLHPERLALAFLKTGDGPNARAFNYTLVEDFELEPEGEGQRVKAVRVKDLLTGESGQVRGKAFVNATGPWMDLLIEKLKGKKVHRLNRSQGIHILVPSLGENVNILNRNKSGRHFFLLSWMGMSLIGPTDTPYQDHPDDLKAKQDDVLQLIQDVNEALPEEKQIRPEDVKQVIIGIRPLISTGESEGTYKVSRKAEMFDHGTIGYHGLLSVAGGKWTTSRQLGEDVIHKILSITGEGKNYPSVDTRFEPLSGSRTYGEDPEQVEKEMVQTYSGSGLDQDILTNLYVLYGTEMKEVIQLASQDQDLAQRISTDPGKPGYDEILAQVAYAVGREYGTCLSDVLNRRLKVGSMGLLDDGALERVAGIIASRSGKGNDWVKEQVSHYRETYPVFPGNNP